MQYNEASIITEKVTERSIIKPISKLFSLTPSDIIRYGKALLLGKGTHKSQQKLSLGVKGVDILLLKEDTYVNRF